MFSTNNLIKQRARLGTIVTADHQLIIGRNYCIVDLGLGEWNSGFFFEGWNGSVYVFRDTLEPMSGERFIFSQQQMESLIKSGEIAFEI